MQKISRRKFGFQCNHCKQWVVVNQTIGTQHRNHCPMCLWSLHVDLKKPGDRKSLCHGSMGPIGLVFKDEGTDKYGNKRQGEIMLVHHCMKCDEISVNRIAADDDAEKILEVFESTQTLESSLKESAKAKGLVLLKEKDTEEIERQMFGKTLH